MFSPDRPNKEHFQGGADQFPVMFIFTTRKLLNDNIPNEVTKQMFWTYQIPLPVRGGYLHERTLDFQPSEWQKMHHFGLQKSQISWGRAPRPPSL